MHTRLISRQAAYLELAGLGPYVAAAPPALAVLALACDAVLALPGDDVPWFVRMRVADLKRTLEAPRDDPAPARQVEPAPTTFGARRAANGWALRLFHGDWRDLAAIALNAGFTPERTRKGHVRFLAPAPSSESFVIPTGHGDAASQGRALANARAQARRAGVPC